MSIRNTKLRKKRKRSNADNVLNDMVDKLLKRKEHANKQFLEFEERRLTHEEQMEERRQIREQAHEKEMQMMFLQLMQQAMHRNAYASFPQCQLMRVTLRPHMRVCMHVYVSIDML